MAVEDPMLKRNRNAVLLLKILGNQIFEKNECARAVGQCVKELGGNAVFVNDDAQCTSSHLGTAHIYEWVAVFLTDFGG